MHFPFSVIFEQFGRIPLLLYLSRSSVSRSFRLTSAVTMSFKEGITKVKPLQGESDFPT